MLNHYQREQMIWQAELPGNEKLLLLALNSFVDANGQCFPGQERLAAMTGFSDRTVRNLCKALEQKTIIQRRHRQNKGGQRTSDLYEVNFYALDQPENHDKTNRKITTFQPENHDIPTGKSRQNQPENHDKTNRKNFPGNYPEDLSSVIYPDKGDVQTNEHSVKGLLPYQGSKVFLDERPWIRKWNRVNPEYVDGWIDFLSQRLSETDWFKAGASQAQTIGYVSKANSAMSPETVDLARLQQLHAWWGQFQQVQADKQLVATAPKSEAGLLPWEVSHDQ